MKRPNGAGTVRKLGGKRRRPWAAVITTGWDPETGRRLQKYVGYFETYQEAELALAVYRAGPLPKDDLTLEMVYAEWKTLKYSRISKSTGEGYEYAWTFLAPLGQLKIKDIRTGQLQRIIDTATCQPKGRHSGKRPPARKCSGSTLSKIRALSVILWDYAVQNDILEKNYARFVALPKEHKKEKECFSALEIAKIREAANAGVPWADAVLIMIYSGFRISEFLSLDQLTVDLEQMTFRAGVKTDAGRNRLVPIHPICLPFVRSRLAQGGQRLICKSDGSPMTAENFRMHCYYPALEQCGVRRLTPHATRHTFATMLAEARVPAVEIQRLLGHAQYAVTANTYTHIDVNALRDAVASL